MTGFFRVLVALGAIAGAIYVASHDHGDDPDGSMSTGIAIMLAMGVVIFAAAG